MKILIYIFSSNTTKSIKKQIICILLFFLSLSNSINSQDISNNPFYDLFFKSKSTKLDNTPYHFKVRINLLDQFFARFNMEMDIEGHKIDSNEVSKILLLPNNKYYWNEIRKSMLHFITNPPAYYRDTILYQQFENTIIRNNTKLDYKKDNWYAIAKANTSFNNKNTPIYLILRIGKENDGFKWLIESIIFPAMIDKMPSPPDYSYKDYDKSLFINPVSHETNFIDLKNIFNSKNILAILSPSMDKNKKDKLVNLIYKKKIKINYIENIKFAFFQGSGFAFFAEYFNRKELNSGWLISDIIKQKASEDNIIQIIDYLKNKESQYNIK